MSFIFGGKTGETPDSIARKRQIADLLAGRIGRAQNVGQGFGDMLSGIGAGISRYQANKAEKDQTAAAQSRYASYNPIADMLRGGTQSPQSSGGAGFGVPAPTAPQPQTKLPQGLPSPSEGAQGAQVAAMLKRPSMPVDNWLSYDNQGAIRNQPINPKLSSSLSFLPEMGVNMKVFSGGQDADGPRRTGSRRHDHGNSADVFFMKDGRKLDWQNQADIPILQQIVARAKANGVTGFGAGDGYMQPGSMHVGFGTPAVWGAGGKGENAPDWLRQAFNGGAPQAPGQMASNDPESAFAIPSNAPSGDVPRETAQLQPQQQPQSQFNPEMLQQSQAILSDPWASPELKSQAQGYLNMMMQQYQQQNDPKYQMDLQSGQLGLEKSRIEIDQMRNPQMTPYQKAQIEIDKLKAANSNGGSEYGLNPVWLQNENKEWMLVQPSKDGSAPRPMQFPEGYKPAPQNRTVDTGTGYVTQPTRGDGALIGDVIPKNLAEEAAAKKMGADQGDNEALLRSMKAKMPGLEKVVGELDVLADKASYTLAGQAYNEGRKQLGFGPSEGAVARTQYAAVVANQVLPLLRDTFGAQFTASEGERLLATLGNPDVTPAEKKAVLRSFIDQKKRDIEGLSIQTGTPLDTPPKEDVYQPSYKRPKVGEVRDGYKFVGGDPNFENSWQKVQ